jgi:hypothetical protein
LADFQQSINKGIKNMIIRFPSLKTKIVEFVLIASNFIHITIFGLDILRFKNQGGDGLEQ